MSDFTAIGQLVTEARNLLDSIKGGAIRTMETTFASLIANVNSEWAAKKSQVDNEALAAIGRVDTETVRSEMGFEAINYNTDFFDTKIIDDEHEYPLGMGVRKEFNDCIKAEMISVKTQSDPTSRPEEAKELLNFMGIGDGEDFFSKSFNILKITVIDSNFMLDERNYDIFIPDQHVKRSPSTSFMMYYKSQGTLSEDKSGLGSSDKWKQVLAHYSSSNPGSYTNIDLRFNSVSVGDVIYLALPTICVGHFPASKKHGVLYNPKTELIRKIDALHDA